MESITYVAVGVVSRDRKVVSFILASITWWWTYTKDLTIGNLPVGQWFLKNTKGKIRIRQKYVLTDGILQYLGHETKHFPPSYLCIPINVFHCCWRVCSVHTVQLWLHMEFYFAYLGGEWSMDEIINAEVCNLLAMYVHVDK
jgi:hypothetical protein